MEKTVENSAMFWLRCNKCYRLIKRSTKTFSLTQCQHLFCSECIVGAEKKCPECESVGVKIIHLAKPLQQSLSHYFENVGTHVQRAFEVAHFQRIQRNIALRRFADIQCKYDEMRRTYNQSAEHMKSLVAAYAKLKEDRARFAADIAKFQSNQPMTNKGRVKDMTNPNFMRESADCRPQQGQHMMDCMMASSRSYHNESRNECGSSSLNSSWSSIATPERPNWHSVTSLNSSRSSIAPPFPQHNRRLISTFNSSDPFAATRLQEHHHRHPSQQHPLPSGYHNRPTTKSPEYRYGSNGHSPHLDYESRVIMSHIVTPMKDTRNSDVDWATTNRRPGSAGVSTDYSSSSGTTRHTPIVIDNYLNYS